MLDVGEVNTVILQPSWLQRVKRGAEKKDSLRPSAVSAVVIVVLALCALI